MSIKGEKVSVQSDGPKLSATTIIAVFLLLAMGSTKVAKSDDICDAIVVDAITELQNHTIVIFKGKNVWLMNREAKTMSGPCPTVGVFSPMTGPVVSAMTITAHDTITEFIGSSVYFGDKEFYTFRNMGPYSVEWGSLVYLPHKGRNEEIGASSPVAVTYMKQKMSYAFFDPIEKRSRFVFADDSVLSFAFDVGAQYDTPTVATIHDLLQGYGLQVVPNKVKAALTLKESDGGYALYLFTKDKYCSIKLTKGYTKSSDGQECALMPTKEFLMCDKIVRKPGSCGKGDAERPVETGKNPSGTQSVSSPESKTGIKSRSDSVPSQTDTTPANRSHDVRQHFNKFTLIFVPFIVYYKF